MAVASTSSGVGAQIQQVSDSLYEVYKTEGTPSVQILLFHGLPSGDLSDAHLLTWKTGNGSRLWEWLAEEFPSAHIYTVSYQGWVTSSDMYVIRENLMSNLISAKIGQFSYCPVILVGHCVGGLVIREVCSQAYKRFRSSKASETEVAQLAKFLENLRGIFDYSTPHRGSSRIANVSDGPLFKYFKTLNKNSARLNADFDDLRGHYKKWRIYGLGESLPTRSVEQGLGGVEVPEASSREGDNYLVVAADHISICQPQRKIDTRFSHLKKLIDNAITIIAAEEIEEEIRVRERKRLHEDAEREETARVQEQKRLKRAWEEAIREEARLLEAYPENFQYLPELIGVEEQVEEIVGKLDDVKILSLTGMGGSGKTTLAMVVFNKLCPKFEFTCFVQDIKLIPGSEDDVKKAVLERLHRGGKRVEACSMTSLRGKRVLFVLDDICDRVNKVLSHLVDVVSVESRFIVTCRQLGLLKISNRVHKVDLLNEENSKLLFMKCVFPEKEVPPVELEALFGTIVKKCDGLPLTLEVLGKYLENEESSEHWEQTLKALEKVEDVSELDNRLWAKLRLSYDGLTQVEQQMFLDATTFFNGKRWTLREAKLAWRAAYKTPSEGLQWKTLVGRSLVYDVAEDDNIKVHEQLRSLGRKIASEPKNYGEYRIWDGTAQMLQIPNALDGKEIHALCLRKLDEKLEVSDSQEAFSNAFFKVSNSEESDKAIHIARTTLQNLKKLQFLEATESVVIDGATERASFPTSLVLLSCLGHHSLFDPTLQTQLAVLKLFKLDYLPDSIQHLSCLTHLEVRGCKRVIFPPKFFDKLTSLRTFILEDCRGSQRPFFFNVIQGFLSLPELEHFDSFSCHTLQSLPESFGQLSSLSHLEFHSCSALHTLPESFGQLSSLSHLEFHSCSALHTLPESFGQLSSLSHLRFQLCNALHTLPESFGQLSSLSHLEFRLSSALHTLPESFGQLSSLSHLAFHSWIALHTLPESFGQLSSLSHLKFDLCSALHTLPESFGQLSSLSHLEFQSCDALATLPESFGELSSLSHLKFYHCDALATLPESFGELSSLSHLKFYYCNALHTLPESFGQLSSLRHLEFYACSALPESFSARQRHGTSRERHYLQMDSLLDSCVIAPQSSGCSTVEMYDNQVCA